MKILGLGNFSLYCTMYMDKIMHRIVAVIKLDVEEIGIEASLVPKNVVKQHIHNPPKSIV